jgi:hydroxyacylglutathione hydrolase
MRARELAVALAGTVIFTAGLRIVDVGPGTTAAAQGTEADAPRIPMSAFKKLYDEGGVIVLDVRGADAYRQGHIRGALSVPLETVAARAGEWRDARKPVVAYCS